ncbi:ice-binding family protein [Kitasatospora sp. NPDC051705]|uniref:ice-binding family protein n=1 Tax=Kitasatospora sp. NPDC051705 TaxID=3364057 RepID=UPI0037AF60C4
MLSAPPGRGRRRARLAGASVLLSGLTLLATAGLFPNPAHAATAPVGLGTDTSYAVLAGSTVTNTGPSDIYGDLGLFPGTSVTGFPPGAVHGVQHVNDAQAAQAQSDPSSPTTTPPAGPPRPS